MKIEPAGDMAKSSKIDLNYVRVRVQQEKARSIITRKRERKLAGHKPKNTAITECYLSLSN